MFFSFFGGHAFGKRSTTKWTKQTTWKCWILVGGFNHLEKYESQWEG
jgi:hypothetical protein